MARKGKSNSYFDDFVVMAQMSCRAAEYLQSVLNDFAPEQLPEHREALHKIEHEEDDFKHEMLQRLVKEFITPIDREDILQLANQFDDVTDAIEDILIRLYMYNVQALRPEAIAFTDIIVKCCKALLEAATEFAHFQKSTTLAQAIINVNTMEEDGDALYIEAVRALSTGSADARETMIWIDLFDRLEECCDACENVADLMELVIMKNS